MWITVGLNIVGNIWDNVDTQRSKIYNEGWVILMQNTYVLHVKFTLKDKKLMLKPHSRLASLMSQVFKILILGDFHCESKTFAFLFVFLPFSFCFFHFISAKSPQNWEVVEILTEKNDQR